MNVAVIKESFPGETRVALIPSGVNDLTKAGFDVTVETGAGEASLHSDQEYESQGARIDSDRARLLSEADVVVMVRGPGAYREFPPAALDRAQARRRRHRLARAAGRTGRRHGF